MKKNPKTERKAFHFALDSAPDKSYSLRAFGRDIPLQRHTPQSLAAAISRNPALGLLPAAKVTHFAEAELPTDRPHLLRVFGETPVNVRGPGGKDYPVKSLMAAKVHIPTAAAREARRARLAREGAYSHPKLAHYGASALRSSDHDDLATAAGLDEHIGPDDTAAALTFHHPELMNLNPEHAQTVHDDMATRNNLHHLSGLCQVDETGKQSWNAPKILDDGNGKPLEYKGDVLCQYELCGNAANVLVTAVHKGMTTTKNNHDLEGQAWHQPTGVYSVPATSSTAADTVLPAAERGEAGVTYQLANCSPNAGLSIKLTGCQPDQFTIEVTNSFVRYLSLYARYRDAKGEPIKLDSRFSNAQLNDFGNLKDSMIGLFGDDYAKYIGIVPNENVFMGIPVRDQTKLFPIAFPPRVTVGSVEILAGGLGHTWDTPKDDRVAARMGLALTCFFDLALPTYTLITTAGSSGTKLWDATFKNPQFLGKTAYSIYTVVKDVAEGSTDNAANDLKSALLKLADSLARAVMMDPAIMSAISGVISAEEAAEAVPFIGWGIKAALCTATAAQLAETIGEVVASPMVMKYEATVSMTIQVKLTPISERGFPQTSETCQVRYEYTDGTCRETDIVITAASRVPTVVTTRDLPVGGKVKVHVAILSKEGYTVGSGISDQVVNEPPDAQQALVIDVNVKEELYPLVNCSQPDPNGKMRYTQYEHSKKLTFRETAYRWEETDPPEETANALEHAKVEELSSITLNSDWCAIGYSWSGNNKNLFQNIASFALNPNRGLKVVPNPLTGSVKLVYLRAARSFTKDGDPSPPDPAANSYSFFLDPLQTADEAWHLRQVVLEDDPAKTSAESPRRFILDQSKSWGRFYTRPDDLAIHANGYVISISRDKQKLLLLKLPPQGVQPGLAPVAMPLSGPGTRAGLVSDPKLVAMAPDGRVLVLEQASGRVQAFDVRMNPVPSFEGGRCWFALHQEADDPDPTDLRVHYLSLGVEIKGYVYVLWYKGTGGLASDFRLDIYKPDGGFLTRTEKVNAAGMVVDLWRNVFTLNYESFQGYEQRWEPSISEWSPRNLDCPAGAAS